MNDTKPYQHGQLEPKDVDNTKLVVGILTELANKHDIPVPPFRWLEEGDEGNEDGTGTGDVWNGTIRINSQLRHWHTFESDLKIVARVFHLFFEYTNPKLKPEHIDHLVILNLGFCESTIFEVFNRVEDYYQGETSSFLDLYPAIP